MSETCPSCCGDRITDVPDRLAAYDHDERCALAHAEAETLAEDAARFRRYGTTSRHRPTTHAERLLLAASGVRPEGVAVFTRVEWRDGQRIRTWRRQPLLAVDAVAVPVGSGTPLGGAPSEQQSARTDRETNNPPGHAPTTVFPCATATERPCGDQHSRR